jgi:hypothetical protein
MGKCFVWGFSILWRVVLALKSYLWLIFVVFFHQLEAYEPATLRSKYQTGVIDYNFYYHLGNDWMPKMKEFYGDSILRVRRSLVPGTIVDQDGNLYTVSLEHFDGYGPNFRLSKFYESGSGIKSKIVYYAPWLWAYGCTEDSGFLNTTPCFENDGADEGLFRRGFHNTLNGCIFQEIEKKDENIYIFHNIPTYRLIGTNYKNFSDGEGGLLMKFDKEFLEQDLKKIDKGDNENRLCWGLSGCRYNCEYSNWRFPKHEGNFHGFLLNENLHFFHFCRNETGSGRLSGVMHYIRYGIQAFDNKYMCTIREGSDQTSSGIIPRFFKIGNYVYFAMLEGGYWIRLYRIGINSNTMGSVQILADNYIDYYLEKPLFVGSNRKDSYAGYFFDFCLLEKDGSPITPSSSGDTEKILCVFGLGGGGANTSMTPTYKWTSNDLNWGHENIAGILRSVLLPAQGKKLANAGGGALGLGPWAQNTIYVTGLKRGSGDCVSIDENSKGDINRLYLNSHKIVPYTSPTGKHYIIYAYCYPGKKEQLYLGYAQYFVDKDNAVRLLTKMEFKSSTEDDWGDSFGDLVHCSRIISMDLKNGHLWITFIKDTDTDAVGSNSSEKKAAGCYRYFHILVKDLIQE